MFIVQQCIHTSSLCSMVFTPVHCAAVYSHQFVVHQCIHTCPLCSSVFTPVHCAAVYSHLSIFAGAIASNGGNYGYVFVFSGKSDVCQQFAVYLNQDVVTGVWFVVQMWVLVCGLLE